MTRDSTVLDTGTHITTMNKTPCYAAQIPAWKYLFTLRLILFVLLGAVHFFWANFSPKTY